MSTLPPLVAKGRMPYHCFFHCLCSAISELLSVTESSAFKLQTFLILNCLGYRIFDIRDSSIYFSSFPVCPSSAPAGFHHLRSYLSVVAPLQSPLSSPQSVLSASPRTPRGYGRRHCGRAFCRRAIWGSSVPRRGGR